MNKNNFIKYYILLVAIAVTGLMIYLSNNVLLDIISFLLLVITAFFLVKFDYIHPYMWFGAIYTLYSISHPILFYLGESWDAGYSKELIFMQWLGLVIFLLVVTPKQHSIDKLNERKIILTTSKYIYFGCLAFLIFFITILSQGSYTNKTEMYSGGSVLINSGFRIAIVFFIAYAYELVNGMKNGNKKNINLMIGTLIIAALITYYSAERDILLRYVTITFFVYYVFSNEKEKFKLKFLPPLLILLVPFLTKIKYLGMAGEITDTSHNSKIASFLKSDFASASKNLQVLIEDEGARGLFNGFTFVSDIVRTLKLDAFFDKYSFSVIEWFNNLYFAENRAGQGFTLVGEGYVNFGYLGVILLLIIVSILIKIMYYYSSRYFNGFIIYILSIPIFMYSIRADFSNILSPIIVHVLLGIIIIKIIDYILMRSIKY